VPSGHINQNNMLEIKLKKKIEELVNDSKSLFDEYQNEIVNHSHAIVDGTKEDHNARFKAFRTSCLSFLKKIEGENSDYYHDFVQNTGECNRFTLNYTYNLLLKLQNDIENGWIIEMADYLLNKSFKDPAAVILGSVLEEKLRELCTKNGIDIVRTKNDKTIPKKASAMNDELASKSVYNKLIQKSITAWLDLRNKAAHGKFGEYDLDLVKAMSMGIRNFILNH